MSAIISPAKPREKLKLLNLDDRYEDHYSLFTDFVNAVVESEWCDRRELFEHLQVYAQMALEEPEGLTA